MGNATNSSQKAGSTTNGTGNPAWANVGSDAYKQQNNLLQTAPIAAANQTIAQGGQGKTTQDVIGQLTQNGGANGMMQQAGDAYKNTLGQAGQGGAANQYLTGYAKGDYLNGSPELDNIISKTNQKVGDQVNQSLAAAGRYGSATHQGTLADSIASNTSNLLYNNYNQQQQNQMNAANALENSQQGRMGLGLNAANGLGQLGQAAQGNLGAAAGLENQGFQNMLGMIGQLPTIQGNKTYDANQQMGLGNKLDQASQNQLNDLIKQWGQGDMQDWARLGGLINAGTQTAGNWGTQTTTSQQPPNLLGALGSLLTAPMTGGGSIFGNMFASSDARLKENIRRIGEKNGHTLYEFNYRGGKDRYRGVMAQDVLKTMPEAVALDTNGFYVVDYSKIGFPMEAV